MLASIFEFALEAVINWALSVALIASALSLLGIAGGHLYRSAAYRHFWLLTTLVTILWLPIAIVVVPRSFYPDLSLPIIPLMSETSDVSWIGYLTNLPSEPTASPNRPRFSILVWTGFKLACGVWLLGVIPCLARVMWGWGKLKRVRLQGTVYRLPKRTASFLKQKYSVRRLPEVILTGHIQNALAVGIFRPQIMVQRRLVHELSAKQLCDVLDHEMAHVVRRDCLVLFLEQVARACHWCNPLLLWLCNELARCREQLCDNHVLDRRPAFAYGETLLRVAELSLGTSLGRRFVAMLSNWSDLRWRMRAILDPAQSRCAAVGRWRAVAMIGSVWFCGWLVGGISFTTERIEEANLLRSHADADLVETNWSIVAR